MERLVNVVGRTLVIVDEDWRVTERAWCLYEVSNIYIAFAMS
jgi:hypothetical protein